MLRSVRRLVASLQSATYVSAEISVDTDAIQVVSRSRRVRELAARREVLLNGAGEPVFVHVHVSRSSSFASSVSEMRSELK
jgi:hypothetical protein